MFLINGFYSDAEAFDVMFGRGIHDFQGMSDAIWAHMLGLDEE